MSEIYLAGGCFWGLEKYLASIPGVLETHVGYANGTTDNPTYEEVCYRNTGHAETVHVVYDADTVPLDFLLTLYFEAIDPVSLNRQGGDTGTQYRTGIYYVKENDRPIIEHSLSCLQRTISNPSPSKWRPFVSFFLRKTIIRSIWTKTQEAIATLHPSSLKKLRRPWSILPLTRYRILTPCETT